MPHDIIDNRSEKLLDNIKRILPGSERARFAVGYLFLPGLKPIHHQRNYYMEQRSKRRLGFRGRCLHPGEERTP